jgi:hypothetical protein
MHPFIIASFNLNAIKYGAHKLGGGEWHAQFVTIASQLEPREF